MNLHEYQAKLILSKHGLPVNKGFIARSAVEAQFAMIRLKSDIAVVKAQVHAGGRGKAGGVKIVKSPEECFDIANKLLGTFMVTKQTGQKGKIINKLYIEKASKIKSEYYLAILIDRNTSNIVIMFSEEGGMDIEDLAKSYPEKIIKIFVNPQIGLQDFHLRKLWFKINMDISLKDQLFDMIDKLYHMFINLDMSLLEINPLISDQQNNLSILDVKINIDDNALYRHHNIEFLRDFAQEDIREIEASKYGLNYIGLDGNIGCMVNGAGLAMATMDIIKHYGGEPANFLDVGGGATEMMVKNAFRIILTDDKVKAIFVNIFGGIMKCDIIASGLVNASKELDLKVPLIVRLEGTNVDKGKEILQNSDLKIISAKNMSDGAQKVVNALGDR